MRGEEPVRGHELNQRAPRILVRPEQAAENDIGINDQLHEAVRLRRLRAMLAFTSRASLSTSACGTFMPLVRLR